MMRFSRRYTWSVLFVTQLALVTLQLGCGEDFAPYNRLESLRVLAIRSDPAAPAPGEVARLTPLVYVPADQGSVAEDVRYSWRWCPFVGSANDGYPCLVDEAQLAMWADASGQMMPPTFDLGSEPTANLPHSIDPALLESLCKGTSAQPALLDCEGGFPVQVRLSVRTDAEEVVAVRTLRLRLDDDEAPNENPRIEGLQAVVNDEPMPLEADAAVVLPRARNTRIRAQVPEDVAESYTGRDEDGNVAEKRERLILTWFVEAGSTRSERTSFTDGVTRLPAALENRWKPSQLSEYPKDTARLIVVIRDERGGVGWREASVTLESTP